MKDVMDFCIHIKKDCQKPKEKKGIMSENWNSINATQCFSYFFSFSFQVIVSSLSCWMPGIGYVVNMWCSMFLFQYIFYLKKALISSACIYFEMCRLIKNFDALYMLVLCLQ